MLSLVRIQLHQGSNSVQLQRGDNMLNVARVIELDSEVDYLYIIRRPLEETVGSYPLETETINIVGINAEQLYDTEHELAYIGMAYLQRVTAAGRNPSLPEYRQPPTLYFQELSKEFIAKQQAMLEEQRIKFISDSKAEAQQNNDNVVQFPGVK